MKRRSLGTLVKRPSGLFMAKWQFDGKTYTRTCKTHDRKEALRRLEEYIRPFQEVKKFAGQTNYKDMADGFFVAHIQLEMLAHGELSDEAFDEIYKFICDEYAKRHPDQKPTL